MVPNRGPGWEEQHAFTYDAVLPHLDPYCEVVFKTIWCPLSPSIHYLCSRHCWPGESAYLDMLNPTVRDWWADQFSTSVYEGSTTDLYIWNDMNEPSVFNGPEVGFGAGTLGWGAWGRVWVWLHFGDTAPKPA